MADEDFRAEVVFPTKVDAWLVAVLLLGLAVAAGSVIAAARSATTMLETVVALSTLLVPYGDIRAVEPTRAPWSSPEWSLERLWIHRTTGLDLMISPRDKNRFLVELRRRASHLRSMGDGLVS